MGDVTLDDQSSLLLQIPDDLTVGSLDVLALVFGDFGGESTSFVDRARGDLVISDDTVSHTDSVIVVTPGRGLVDDTGTGILGDIGVRDDSEGPVFELSLISLCPVTQPDLVLPTDAPAR